MLFKRNRINPNQVPFITLPSSLEEEFITDKQKNDDKSSFKKGNHMEIFVKCRDIISVDLFSKTDPFIVFYVRRYGKWLEYSRTEIIANSSRPIFTETICVEATNTDNNMLKASLFDGENINSHDLQKCRHVGSVEFELGQLKRDYFTEFLMTQENGKTVGVLCLCGITIENIIECKKEVRFSIGAGRIAKKNFFHRANVYMEISRELFQNTFHTVYRSEVIFKTNTPHWKLFTVNAQRLYNNNKNTNLLFQIFGHNVKGEPELKGQVVLTLAKLIRYQGVVKEIALRKFSSSKRTLTSLKSNNNNNSSNAGYLKLYHVSFQEQYSLIDYVRSGICIKASIAIDFTLSNGYPLTSERSLHCLDHPQNEYIEAIKQMGTWISYYCDSVPMVGFGGKLHSKTFTSLNRNSMCYVENGLKNLLTKSDETNIDNITNNNDDNGEKYCFQISKNDSDMDTLIESYKKVVCMVEPGGPTYFEKVLTNLFSITSPSNHKSTTTKNYKETATEKNPEATITNPQKTLKNKPPPITLTSERENEETTDFSIALIITDGVSNDEGDLEKFLFELTNQPIIIIVAGVGPCLFTPTQYLVNRVNRKVKRRMVFFYKVNDTIEKKSDIKELYAAISKAIVDFFVHKKVFPKHVENSNPLDTMDHNTELNYRPSSPMFEPKTCCPTCGSYVDLTSQI